ncbi:MAG: winged helix-turn-helix domain-containing protein [Elusimicrobiales bacterium]|nr:winged helix-turn-helix domain-containing protein [Elusimicrobiales bacterium]
MIKFALWLISPDRELSEKWYRLFSREHLLVTALPGLADVSQIPQETWGIALMEICPKGVNSPEDLKTFLKGRKNISIMLFSKPGKTSNQEISAYLEAGADDFLTSDMDERVLFSKIRAHIRRLLPSLNLARTCAAASDGSVEIDTLKRTVRLGPVNGKNLILDNLTPKEFDILFMLLSDEGQVVSRKSLMESIWGDRCGQVNFETIDKHVETLRRKLKTFGKNIRTVYGTGYTYKRREREAS